MCFIQGRRFPFSILEVLGSLNAPVHVCLRAGWVLYAVAIVKIGAPDHVGLVANDTGQT